MFNTRKRIELTFCHRKPERSFFFRGKQFPVCARCTGIHIGYIAMPFFLFDVIKFNLWVTIIFVLTTIIDGLAQAYLDRESNNLLRVTSGMLTGVGLMSLMSILGKNIADYLNTLQHV